MESVISPVCALRLIKTRGHSLLARLRQRGASGQSSCVGLFGCPIPFYLFDYLYTRLYSTTLGTNVSLCGSESQSCSNRIKSLWDRKTERVTIIQAIVLLFNFEAHAWYDVSRVIKTGGGLGGNDIMETKRWMRNDKYFPITACPFTSMAPTKGLLASLTSPFLFSHSPTFSWMLLFLHPPGN